MRYSVYAADGEFIAYYRSLRAAVAHARSIGGRVKHKCKVVWNGD